MNRQELAVHIYRRARHVIGEIERTLHVAEYIRASNWLTAGQLMNARAACTSV
jgi:galactokinase